MNTQKQNELFVECDLTAFENESDIEQFKRDLNVSSERTRDISYRTEKTLTLQDNTTITFTNYRVDPDCVSVAHVHIYSTNEKTVQLVIDKLIEYTSYRKGEDYDGWIHTGVDVKIAT